MTRRELLQTMGAGFGMVGLAELAGRRNAGGPAGAEGAALSRQGEARHLPVPERRAVAGGHVRPEADARRSITASRCPAGNLRTERKTGNLMRSPFTFKKYGQSGIEVSEIFPQARRVHRRSVRHPVDVHGPSESRAVAVHDEQRREAAGAAVDGFVGDLRAGHGESEPAGLRGAVSRAAGGRAISSGARRFCRRSTRARTSTPRRRTPDKLIQNIRNKSLTRRAAARQLDLLATLNRLHMKQQGADPQLEACIQSAEIAFRMQTEAPEASTSRKETGEDARALRRQRFRPRLPDGAAAGGARRAHGAGLFRQLPALGQPRRHPDPPQAGGAGGSGRSRRCCRI